MRVSATYVCRDTDIMDSTLATSLIQFTNCMATVGDSSRPLHRGVQALLAGM
jgi:hypothetical protein